jgi:DNA-binding NarL/FixJ family response regulator
MNTMTLDEQPGAMGPDAPVRVLLADDHPLIRRLLRTALVAHGGIEVVGEAADGREAVRIARALQPDVVVIDFIMPGVDGLRAAPIIRAALPDCRILVFSEYQADSAEALAVAAGADGYLEKAAGFAAAAEAVAALAQLRSI